MLAHVFTFTSPKRGCLSEECEDAAWVGPDGTTAGEVSHPPLRVAVADGATESLMARQWAKRLTEAVAGSSSTKRAFMNAYFRAAENWDAEMANYRSEREERGKPVQWYEEPGLARGAFATIIGVEFLERGRGKTREWRSVAVGDSCLFQVRAERLHCSFPMQSASDFSSQPQLVPSSVGLRDRVGDRVVSQRGDWQSEDSFYVTTDALAAWFLRSDAAGQHPWGSLRDLLTRDMPLDFDGWVNEKRDVGELRDDDTTLVRIDFSD
jgi:hypothetical protein